MKNNRQIQTTNIGIVSLIMVIVIISMTVLTLLSLSEATRDYNYSVKLAQHSTEYYEASNRAQEQIAAISRAAGNEGVSEAVAIDGIDEFTVRDSKVLFTVGIGDREKLAVEVDISGGKAHVISYEEVQAGEWNGDTNLHVMPLE